MSEYKIVYDIAESEEDFHEYEKPILAKIEKMDFMFDGIKTLSLEQTCRQCSSCHGCRG